MTDAGLTTEQVDEIFVEQVRLSVQTARSLREQGGLPTQEVPVLERRGGGLVAGLPESEPDWRLFMPMLTRTHGFWDRIKAVGEELRGSKEMEERFGWASPDSDQRWVALWGTIAPLVQVYMLRRSNWEWDEDEARAVLALWRQSMSPNEVELQLIAPLHNLSQWGMSAVVDEDLAIRDFTDEERQDLWRTFGGPQHQSQIAPTFDQIEQWASVVDLRLKRPAWPPLTGEQLTEVGDRIERLVCAQRLRHPGTVGVTIVWVRPVPPEMGVFARHLSMLFARDRSASFEPSLPLSQVGPSDGQPLAALLEKITVTNDKRLSLALRRFNSSYARQDPADVLIDLWVAIEALLLPDGNAELSYRAALRLARAAGTDEHTRRSAFDQAKASYRVRSKLVHGDDVSDEKVKATVAETRNLLRDALRTWLLNPPLGGVQELDHQLLA
jgi:hypothetical protein